MAAAAALGIFVVFTHLRLAALEGKVAGLQARRRCLFYGKRDCRAACGQAL